MANAARINRRRLFVLPPESGWTNKLIAWTNDQEAVADGRVVPIFVARPDWLVSRHLEADAMVKCRVFAPRPWGDRMLRCFLSEVEGAIFDTSERRAILLAGAGGIPERIARAVQELGAIVRTGRQPLDGMLQDWAREQAISLQDVGLDERFELLVRTVETVDVDAIEVLVQLLEANWPKSMGSANVPGLLGLFTGLGIIESGDHLREGVRVSVLGSLLKRGLERERVAG